MNSAQIATDKQLEQMEKELEKIYKQSEKELTKKWNEYMKRSSKAIQSHEKALKAAQKTKDDKLIREAEEALKKAKQNQTLRNQYYQNMLDSVTYQLATVNQTALAYVNGQMPSVYMTNYNFGKVEADSIGIRFDLVDEATVRQLVTQGEIKLPNKKVNIPKDQQWNKKQLNSSVLQGILQGESMDDIAKRILPIVGNNQSAAIRNARTMVTGAQNLGAQNRMKALEDDGVVINKVWMATPDGRTRDWHVEMDGQEVGLDEDFVDGLGNELRYPGDPGGAPETVYNCRCTMISHILGFRRKDGTISYVNYQETEESMHERQMREERNRRNSAVLPKPKKKDEDLPELTKFKGSTTEERYTAYYNLLNGNSEVKNLYKQWGDELDSVTYSDKPNSGYFMQGAKKLVYSLQTDGQQHLFSTLAHEYGHAFDFLGREKLRKNLTFNEAEKMYFVTHPFADITSGWGANMMDRRKVPSQSDEYLKAVREDAKNLWKAVQNAEVRVDMKNNNGASSGIQDLLDGFYHTQSGKNSRGIWFSWGHGDKYYNREWNNSYKDYAAETVQALKELGFTEITSQAKAKEFVRSYEAASELWANQMSAVTCGGKELEYMEKYCPKSLAVLRKIIGDV